MAERATPPRATAVIVIGMAGSGKSTFVARLAAHMAKKAAAAHAEYVGRVRGFEVVAGAGTGTEALRVLARGGIDLVLLDVHLPDTNGLEVLRRMRAHANFAENAPIVLLLILLLEFAAGTSVWLWTAAGLFLVARIAHGLGMDEGRPGRGVGTGITLMLQLLLALWAISVPLSGAYSPKVQDIDAPTARG